MKEDITQFNKEREIEILIHKREKEKFSHMYYFAEHIMKLLCLQQ